MTHPYWLPCTNLEVKVMFLRLLLLTIITSTIHCHCTDLQYLTFSSKLISTPIINGIFFHSTVLVRVVR